MYELTPGLNVQIDSVSPLFLAAKNGDLDSLKANQDKIGERDSFGSYLLHYAAYFGQIEVVDWLLDQDIDSIMGQENNQGSTAIHYAAYAGHIKIMELLLASNAFSITETDNLGFSVLMYAVSSHQFLLVQWILKDPEVLVNYKDTCGSTALHIAAYQGHMNLIQWLVDEAQADVNESDNLGNTILHLAVERYHIDLINWLISKKIVNHIRINNNGYTALHLGASSGFLEIVKCFIKEYGVDEFEKAPAQLHSPLFLCAIQSGNWALIQWLLSEKISSGFEVNKHRMTAIHIAAIYGHLSILEGLLEIDPLRLFIKCDGGFSVFLSAVQFCQLHVVQWLLKKCNHFITETNDKNETALDIAINLYQQNQRKEYYIIAQFIYNEQCRQDLKHVSNNLSIQQVDKLNRVKKKIILYCGHFLFAIKYFDIPDDLSLIIWSYSNELPWVLTSNDIDEINKYTHLLFTVTALAQDGVEDGKFNLSILSEIPTSADYNALVSHKTILMQAKQIRQLENKVEQLVKKNDISNLCIDPKQTKLFSFYAPVSKKRLRDSEIKREFTL